MADDKCDGIRPTTSLHWGDILTIAVYFVVVLLVGLWATLRARKDTDARGYFLAGKRMTFLPIGASIFASNIGAPMFVGLAGTASASGIGGMIYEWHAIPFILMLSWVFVPVFTACGVFTMPEYIRRRYGRERLRTYLSVLSILLYVLTKISVEMYAGAVFVQILFGWNIYIAAIAMLAFSAIFTMTGGLTAVIFTDTMQTVILVAGAFVLMGISLEKVGGYEALQEKYMRAVPSDAVNSTCGSPRPDSFSLLRDVTSDYPWIGTLFFNIPADIWFWCSDQIMVQRSLSAKSLSHAKGGSVVAGYLKVLPFYLFVIPGLAARVLYTDEVACVDPEKCRCICDNPSGCSNIAYPLLVLRILNPGLRGLMVAALFAAVMSTLSSVFNSASSIFTMDLWRRCRTRASQWELLIVGRVVVLVLMGLAILWIPVMSAAQGDQLWQYFQMLMSAVGPPWAMVYIMGVFWTRTTEPAAFYGMLGGQTLGFARLILAFVYLAPPCGEEDTRYTFLKIHFLYVAAMEAAVAGGLMVAITFVTPSRPVNKLRRVTYWTRNDPQMPDVSEDEEEDGKERNSPQSETDVTPAKRSTRLEIICGMETRPKTLSREEAALLQQKMTSIKERPKVRRLLDANAIILLAVTTFIIAYYR
ncbi:sodium/glucose cotransporter 4-like [Pomacea canaliculata]|nr:sodium/glucose cotransporter 4-like [Pomacea canaliculata]XP_025113903.1 sodium/glucose cotransporter 4-like [Pomacea canaliculata]XP_025113904.1 sodium/glucose cotransporter 4-like [Pomacea canaliculata]